MAHNKVVGHAKDTPPREKQKPVRLAPKDVMWDAYELSDGTVIEKKGTEVPANRVDEIMAQAEREGHPLVKLEG